MKRRIKIRFAGAKADDVLAFGFELGCSGGDRQSGRWFDLLYAL
jgi:hypothetical protein